MTRTLSENARLESMNSETTAPDTRTGLLTDKMAIVTGASTGIGWAVVRTFIDQGAQVIGVGRREAPSLTNLPDTGAFTFLCGDLTHQTTIDRVAELAVQSGVHVDILINSAAIPPTASAIDAVADDYWERILQTNLLSVARLSARLMPLTGPVRYGRIINIGSVLSMYGAAQCGPFVVSKHALLGLTRTQALEYGQFGITANCILPGGVDTEMFRRGDRDGAGRRYIESKCPLGRLADPREIAAIALFLASPLSSYINGQALVADGGLTVGI